MLKKVQDCSRRFDIFLESLGNIIKSSSSLDLEYGNLIQLEIFTNESFYV
jgi:hypothetical protein